jgi:membrane protein DedA with SNARE-associated domain
VFFGTLAEGETVLMVAGFAAHRGYMALPWVIGAGALGGFLGDQLAYWLGRTRWPALAARFPSLQPAAEKVHDLLERHDVWVIVAIRFMYGLRIAGPIVIGISRVRPMRFAALNLLGAILWAGLIGGLGYAFGQALASVLLDVKRYEGAALTAMVALGLAAWLFRRIRRKRSRSTPG